MRKSVCFVSAVLVLAMMFSLIATPGVAVMISNSPIDMEEGALVNAQLEAMAADYVTRYIHTAYLYEENDFVSDTLLEYKDTAAMGTAQITVNGITSTGSALQENLQQFADVAEYFRYIRQARNIEREDFQMSISNVEVAVSGNSAEVALYTLIAFRYVGNDEPTLCGDNYVVYFQKINDSWCIVDIYSEELEAYGLTKDIFNPEEEIARFDQMMIERQNGNIQIPEQMSIGSTTEIASAAGIQIDLIPYDRNAAWRYANVYTTSTYTADIGDNINFCNTNFPYWGDYGGNCINYASQCVWAGFGGTDTESDVEDRNRPMDTVGAQLDIDEANNLKPDLWYSGSPSWIRCTRFLAYVQNRTGEGVMADVYTVNPGTGFSAIPNATDRMLSAVILTYQDTQVDDPDHAIVVSKVEGTEYEKVCFCSNNPMRRDQSLGDTYFIYYKMSVIIPTYYVMESSCSGHTYTSYSDTANVPSGYGTICNNCGFNNLVVTGSTFAGDDHVGVVARNREVTITGTANITCYRMAIGIRYETDTSGSWIEYYNTSTATRTYSFDRAGLYTITIAARDMNDTFQDTNGASYVFKIRVY